MTVNNKSNLPRSANNTACTFITAPWPAPKSIHVVTSTRRGGVSQGLYHSLNIATHVGDKIEHVLTNRQRLMTAATLPSPPVWLKQVHGNTVLRLEEARQDTPCADALTTTRANIVCAIQTADCLPIAICNRQGTQVAAIHAGWRSLFANIIANTLQQFSVNREDLFIWLAPAISQDCYEIGEDMKHAFCQQDNKLQSAFTPVANKTAKWQASLTHIACIKLRACGVPTEQIYASNYCTYRDSNLFFSYRRDGNNTGRMVTLVWLD